MEDAKVAEGKLSGNHYSEIKDAGDTVVTGTESLRKLHQEFIDKLPYTHKRKKDLQHDLEKATTTNRKCENPSSSWYGKNDSRYYCYKPRSDWLNLAVKTFVADPSGRGSSFEFKGFLILSRMSLEKVPQTRCYDFVNSFTVSLEPHPLPKSFMPQDLLLFNTYLFEVLLEMEHTSTDEIYFYPLFVNKDSGHTATMATVLTHLLTSYKPLPLKPPINYNEESSLSNYYTHHLVHNLQRTPSTLRIDKLSWTRQDGWRIVHYYHVFKNNKPKIAHYSEMRKKYESLHQQSVKGELSRKEYFKLKQLRRDLRQAEERSIREEVLLLSCDSHMTTGLHSDVGQHALILPILYRHILYHNMLESFEHSLGYTFTNRALLQIALTHPSYTSNHGDRPRPLLSTFDRCGASAIDSEPRPPRGTKRPRGLEGLSAAINNPVVEGEEDKEEFNNERLEFLGDAVIELVTSHQLYQMFPDYSDGQLVIYRKALICNKHLARIATERLDIDRYMLKRQDDPPTVDEDPVFCSRYRANAMEAIIGAVYLDSGIQSARHVIATLFFPEKDLYHTWMETKPHPLKQQYPTGDRHLIAGSTVLQKFTELETSIGVEFTNVRLLGRAFVHPSYGCTDMFMGDYQRMEFLGDAVLQFMASVYLYHTFPNSHEGHLSTYRTGIVHNRQLAKVSEELGLTRYILLEKDQTNHITEKIKADVVESLLAALYLDKGTDYAEKFCEVCLFRKLYEDSRGLQFIDAKSRLQHSLVHTCRRRGQEVEAPEYRVLEPSGGGSSNSSCTVGVYFKKKRLAIGTGHNTYRAGMDAAEKALTSDQIMLPTAFQK